ncbi:MAG: hypothetical protein JRJ85_26045 [Deltaproteobacteria bacterium]|nr:hypothetical protein [Deltaproteobacteria bacterium]
MPKRQNSGHDSIEMTETLWISPEEALAKSKAGEILLMPPTLKHIEELSEFSSIDQLFAFASSSKIVPVLPQPFQTEMGVGIKLPYDPEFSLSDYKQPPRPHEKSRIMLINKEWKIISFEDYKKL